MARNFAHLMAPGRIGSMEVRNRIFMTAMASKLCEDNGTCGDRVRAYYEARAKGGAALLTMGSVSVAYPVGAMFQNQAVISEERHIPGLRSVADAVHKHGAKLSLQLHFGGLVAVLDTAQGRPQLTPSIPTLKPSDMADGLLDEEIRVSITRISRPPTYTVMSIGDIEQMVRSFSTAAERAKRAGADAIEIHGGHGYIVSSFLSPLTNHRTDEYGGTLENRARLLVEIIKATRDAVGPDFPILCKIDAKTFGITGGIALADAQKTAQMAQEAGVDAVVVSAYHDTSKSALHSSSHTPHVPDLLVPYAAAIKSHLDIPIVTQGRIEPEHADRYIREGSFDFVAMGRKLLADPDLPKKLLLGQPKDVRPCIYCYTCNSQSIFGRPIKCAVNPETGHEIDSSPPKAAVPKRIVVVGGGPAGMETARRLSDKGHEVTLLEQSDRLGGTIQFAAIAYEPNERILTWLKRKIAQSTVKVHLNSRATPDLITSFEPDEVIVATGAVREMPPIPGADAANVLSGDDMRRLVLGHDLGTLGTRIGLGTRLLLRFGGWLGLTKSPSLIRRASATWMPLGQRIVLVGGDLVGLELAEFLAHRGRQVTVIDEAGKFGTGLPVVRRWGLLAELKELGVTMLPGTQDIRISDHIVTGIDPGGRPLALAADHVIVAKGAIGDLTLADELRSAGFRVHVAGDCEGVGYIEGAIGSAARLAKTL